MGTGYKGGTEYQHSISENIPAVSKDYDYSNGYFGKPTNPKNTFVRIIESDDPVSTGKDFYDKIALGAKIEPLKNGKGEKASMQDGTVIIFRSITKSDNNPGVDINITKSSDNGGLKSQKIHFELKEENEWKPLIIDLIMNY